MLAQGGRIRRFKDGHGRLAEIACLTREGWSFALCTLALFRKLRARRLVASVDGGPYRITRLGLQAVRSRPDNR